MKALAQILSELFLGPKNKTLFSSIELFWNDWVTSVKLILDTVLYLKQKILFLQSEWPITPINTIINFGATVQSSPTVRNRKQIKRNSSLKWRFQK